MRVCLVTRPILSGSHLAVIDDLLQSGHSVPLILYGRVEASLYKKKKRRPFRRLLRGDFSILWKQSEQFAARLCREATENNCPPNRTLRPVNVKYLDQHYPSLKQTPIEELAKFRTGNVSWDVDSKQLEQINSLCDVVILNGHNQIFRGDFLSAAPFGVLSPHSADTFKHRGRPGGFFEWINNDSRLGYTIQRLSNELDGGEVIAQDFVDLKNVCCKAIAMEQLQGKVHSPPTLIRRAVEILEIRGVNARFERPIDSPLHFAEEAGTPMYAAQHILKDVRRVARHFGCRLAEKSGVGLPRD